MTARHHPLLRRCGVAVLAALLLFAMTGCDRRPSDPTRPTVTAPAPGASVSSAPGV